jgi:hypothetical protein
MRGCCVWLALGSAGAFCAGGCSQGTGGGADASVESRASGDSAAEGPPVGDGPGGGPADARAEDSGAAGDASGNDGSTTGDASGANDGGSYLDATLTLGGCASGLVCDGHCVPASDIHRCGSCTNDCADLTHVAAAGLACVNGTCSYSCVPGFAGCDDAAAGCPTDLSLSTSCGGCAQGCAFDSGTANCAPTSDAGTFGCMGACPPGAPTLCTHECVDLMTNVNNCGTCYWNCGTRVAHAHGTCVAGACAFECNPGYSLCGGACVDETSDAANCGGCGVACGTNVLCRAGACVCPLMCGGACVDSDIDPANCGACGHDCLGGACAAGVCQPITLATGQARPWCMTMDATSVYWTNYDGGTVMRVSLDGAIRTTVASGGSEPYALAVDSQYVYWTDANASILWRSPLDGGGMDGGAKMQLYAGAYPGNLLRGVAVARGVVYWADDNKGIFAVPTTGGSPVTVSATGPNTRHVDVACHVALDATNVYWLADFPVGVDSAPLSGGPPTMLVGVPSNLGDTWGIAVDSQRVYFGENQKALVFSVPRGGGAANMLVTGAGYPQGMTVYGDRLYWADSGGTIRSVPVQGGSQTLHAVGQQGPTDVTVDAKAIYWINEAGGSVMKVAK